MVLSLRKWLFAIIWQTYVSVHANKTVFQFQFQNSCKFVLKSLFPYLKIFRYTDTHKDTELQEY